MGTEQIEGADAIPTSMAETDNLNAVDCHQKDVTSAQRAPPPYFAFARFECVCLRAEERGIGVPISLHMDPCDRWNVIEDSSADVDHVAQRRGRVAPSCAA